MPFRDSRHSQRLAGTLSVRAKLLGADTPVLVEQGPDVLGRVDAAGFGNGWLLSWLGAGAPGESVLRLGHHTSDMTLRERIDVVTLPAGRGIGIPRLAALEHVATLVWTEPDDTVGDEPAGENRGASRTRLRAVQVTLSESDHPPPQTLVYPDPSQSIEQPMSDSTSPPADRGAPPEVIHNPAASRFEALVAGHVGVIDYRREGGTLVLPSVRVPRPVEGRGIAAALTRTALDWAREQSLRVQPVCPYVSAWISRHPDYRDLVDAPDAARR